MATKAIGSVLRIYSQSFIEFRDAFAKPEIATILESKNRKKYPSLLPLTSLCTILKALAALKQLKAGRIKSPIVKVLLKGSYGNLNTDSLIMLSGL